MERLHSTDPALVGAQPLQTQGCLLLCSYLQADVPSQQQAG